MFTIPLKGLTCIGVVLSCSVYASSCAAPGAHQAQLDEVIARVPCCHKFTGRTDGLGHGWMVVIDALREGRERAPEKIYDVTPWFNRLDMR